MLHVMPEQSLEALHGKVPGKDAATLARERAKHPRVEEGPIRGTRMADLMSSKYDRGFLEQFAEDVNTDSGLRAVIDRRIVSHLKAARRIIDRDRDAIKAEGVREYLEKHGGGRAGYDADRKRLAALHASKIKADIMREAEQRAQEGVELASAADGAGPELEPGPEPGPELELEPGSDAGGLVGVKKEPVVAYQRTKGR